MRRAFPYIATLLVVGVIAAVFVLRPTPFIGVTSASMASSLAKKLPAAAEVGCEEAGEDAWTCAAAGAGASDRSYEVSINGFGCWTAPPAGRAQIGTPPTLTGCITVFDH